MRYRLALSGTAIALAAGALLWSLGDGPAPAALPGAPPGAEPMGSIEPGARARRATLPAAEAVAPSAGGVEPSPAAPEVAADVDLREARMRERLSLQIEGAANAICNDHELPREVADELRDRLEGYALETRATRAAIKAGDLDPIAARDQLDRSRAELDQDLEALLGSEAYTDLDARWPDRLFR